ncbi:MAG: S8 family serine peptidase [Oscillospiraceae bacterium]|nr:S8 family serine peptidase [Oscillospiraceae bacterium]
MKNKSCSRLLSGLLVIALLLSITAMPAYATGKSSAAGVALEQIADSEVSAALPYAGKDAPENESPLYQSSDLVRVSIVLEDNATTQKFQSANIAENNAAMSYRGKLQTKQALLTQKISAEALKGETLDVVWNLTLAANLISANVKYGEIEAIKKVPGVKDVIIETQYAPCVAQAGGADPNMATSGSQIGRAGAYAAGYTGAGTRIAIIDTGIDTDHQSFDPDAFAYALQKQSEKVNTDYTTYVNSLNLLSSAEITSKLEMLNIKDSVTDASKLYLTAKLPFAFNYVDSDFDVVHDNDTQTEHGSHVAGIAAANSYVPGSEEGTYENALEAVNTQGVAPEAQIITMKVFGKNGGAWDSDYMAAIEDAIILDADSINLSLGSANAGFSTDATYQEILDNLAKSGCVVSMSAGNSYSWVEYAQNAGYLYSDGVNLDTVGSPGSYTNALTVASVDNDGFTGEYLRVGDNLIFYTQSSYTNSPITSIAGEHSYILIDGFGTAEEFAALSDVLAGKIAVCSRGTTSFYEKAEAAVQNGAIATIIYNNQSGTINMDLTGYTQSQPAVSITQADGQLLKAAATQKIAASGAVYYEGVMTVETGVASAEFGGKFYTMSDFSSWGVPGSLLLKPEITAPGGNIYSVNGAIAGGTAYENMSGTSMAAPQVAGMSALLAQYIRSEKLDEKTGLSPRVLAQSLLMSTAVPIYEEESGHYYSLLKQGAGVANIGNAIGADSYLLMGEDATASFADGKIKAELGDDPDREGSYTFSFSIYNRSEELQFFKLYADLFTQDQFDSYVNDNGEIGTYLDTLTTALEANAQWIVDGKPLDASAGTALDFNGDGKVDGGDCTAILQYVTGEISDLSNKENADFDKDGAITSYDAYLFLRETAASVIVRPGSSVTVQVTLELSEAQKAKLNADYPTGAYVEGFVFVEPEATKDGAKGVTHSIPVLGYYGSWSEPSMFDVGTYQKLVNGAETRVPYLGSEYGNYVSAKFGSGASTLYFGGNPYFENGGYYPERNAINTENGSKFHSFGFALIRNAAGSRVTVTNPQTGETAFSQEFGMYEAAYYHVNSGYWYNTSNSVWLDWVPTGADGETYELALTMAPEYYVKPDGSIDFDALKDGATMKVPYVVDNTAPEALSATSNAEKTALTVAARDNQYLACIALYDQSGANLIAKLQPQVNKAGDTASVTFDVTGFEAGAYKLRIMDYAGNLTTYRALVGVNPTSSVESVTLSQDAFRLAAGNKITLTASVNPFNVFDDTVIWTSSDAGVATVDKNGVVTGIADGECEIIATSILDNAKSAACRVSVKTIAYTLSGMLKDKNNQVMSFQWNAETSNTWSKVSNISVDGVGALAGTDHGVYTLNDDLFNRTVRLIDPKTGSELAQRYDAGNTYWDMTHSKLFTEKNGKDYLAYIYSYFLYVPSSPDNFSSAAWVFRNYFEEANTGATCLMTIAAGETGSNDYGNYETFYMLDDAGYVWIAYIYENTSLGREMIPTNLPKIAPYTTNVYSYSSMVVADDGTLFVCVHNGTTSEIYMLELMENEDGEYYFDAIKIGETGETISASLYAATVNKTADENRVSIASIPVSAPEKAVLVSADEMVAVGSLNAADKPAAQPQSSAANTVTVDVTAKNTEGVEVASKNGLFTVTYDASKLTLQNANVKAAYSSVNTAAGTVVIAYAGLQEIAAGETAASLTFLPKTDDTGEIAITFQQINGETVTGSEILPNLCEHLQTERRGAKEPTCTEAGYTGDTYCTICQKLLVAGEAIAPLGHDFVQGETVAPTCTENGYTLYACARCDVTEKRNIVKASGHKEDLRGAKDATCTEAGYTGDTVCAVCKETLEIGAVTAPLGHDYVCTEHKEPTCTEDGYSVNTCQRCGGTNWSSLAAFPCPALQFADISETAWYHQCVDYVVRKGLMFGKSNTVFAPNEKLTRGQMMALLYRLEGEPDVEAQTPFADVKQELYYAKAIAWAYANGIAYGVSHEAFAPEAEVTREQMAAFLARYAAWKGVYKEAEGNLAQFTDSNQVSAYAANSILWAVDNSILSGYTDCTLRPLGNATRAEAANMFMNYCLNIGG